MQIISELQAVELLKATGFEAGQNTMILAYCSLRNEMERNEMKRNEMERNEMKICSLRNENL